MRKSVDLHPRVYEFADSQTVIRLLSEQSDKQTRRFQKFMQKVDKEYTEGVSLFENPMPENDRRGETLVHVLNLSEQWKCSSLVVPRIVTATRRIAFADAISEFRQLESAVQEEIVYSIFTLPSTNPVKECADKAFFRLLKMTGYPVVALKDLDVQTVILYFNKIRANHAAYVKKNPEHKDFLKRRLTMPSTEFLEEINKHVTSFRLPQSIDPTFSRGNYRSMFDPYLPQLALMLRAVYGEQDVIDVLDRLRTEDAIPCPNEIIDLLSDWENMKSYSADWIRQFYNLEHLRI